MKKIRINLVLLLCFIVIISCKNKHQNKKMDNIELSDGTFVQCKSISFEEFDALKLNALGGPIRKFKNEFNVEVYLLNNKEVIANENGYFMLFKNQNDVEKVFSDAHQSSHGAEILNDKNPFGKSFPEHANILIRELSDTLGVKYVQPDEKLLKELDYKLSMLPNGSVFRKKHLLNFIAVIGEVLLKKYKTEWEMILSSDGKTWNPYIRTESRPIEFFTYLYEDIYINENSETLLTEVYETVNDVRRNQ